MTDFSKIAEAMEASGIRNDPPETEAERREYLMQLEELREAQSQAYRNDVKAKAMMALALLKQRQSHHD